MLISSSLSLDRDEFAQNDQVLTITVANWLDYQNFDFQEENERQKVALVKSLYQANKLSD